LATTVVTASLLGLDDAIAHVNGRFVWFKVKARQRSLVWFFNIKANTIIGVVL
jgi:hypothetical protein